MGRDGKQKYRRSFLKTNINHRRLQNYENWAVKVLKKRKASVNLVVARALQGQARRHNNIDPLRTGNEGIVCQWGEGQH